MLELQGTQGTGEHARGMGGAVEWKRHSPGCWAKGTELPMMVQAPFIRPEEPAPATARPAINMGDELAKAQMREPIPKTKRKVRKTNFFRKNVYNFPAIGCRVPLRKRTMSTIFLG